MAAHYRDNGRDDEAAVVRVWWPAIAATIQLGRPLDFALELDRRSAEPLGRLAREVEGRAERERPER